MTPETLETIVLPEVCATLLPHHIVETTRFFTCNAPVQVLDMAQDQVANVRFYVARALKVIIPILASGTAQEKVCESMHAALHNWPLIVARQRR